MSDRIDVQLPPKPDEADRQISVFQIVVDGEVWYEHPYPYQQGLSLTAKFDVHKGDGNLTVNFYEPGMETS